VKDALGVGGNALGATLLAADVPGAALCRRLVVVRVRGAVVEHFAVVAGLDDPAVRGRHLRAGGVRREVLVDVHRGQLVDGERPPSEGDLGSDQMLTMGVAVLVVGTGTAPLPHVDTVARAAVGDDRDERAVGVGDRRPVDLEELREWGREDLAEDLGGEPEDYDATRRTAAEALATLGRPDSRRSIRLDEVRYALAQLSAERLLPSVTAPSVRAIMAALLRADGPLSPAELAEAADVFERSMQRHTDTLAALDVVRETEDGLRLALPTREERDETVLPAVARDAVVPAHGVLGQVAAVVVNDPDRRRRLQAPTDVGERLRGFCEDRDVGAWAPVALSLGTATLKSGPPDRDPPSVTVGPTPQQSALGDGQEVAA